MSAIIDWRVIGVYNRRETSNDNLNLHWQTTSALLWMLYCLARNPAVQDAVYRDTAAVLADNNGHVTPDSLQKLRYIRAWIKESFR